MTMRAGSEAAFQQQVERLAAFYGWRTFHAPDNVPRQLRSGRVAKQRVTAGFPDLVLVRGTELIFAELKTDTGRIAPAQRDWIAALEVISEAVRQAAVQGLGATPVIDVYVWRPADFDEFHGRLARGRRRVEPMGRTGEAA